MTPATPARPPGDEPTTFLDHLADGFSHTPRSPVWHTPADSGLAFEEVTFPSEDGTPLEGWFVPAEGPGPTVIVNHPRFFSRSGLPSHLEPWRTLVEATGNALEVDLVPDLEILHEAGYGVLAHDLRNSGLSGEANGGLTSSGIHESRDVIGALRHVRDRRDLPDPRIGLLSRCLGANATFHAIRRDPRAFDDVTCLVACQPLSPRFVLERTLERHGVDLAAMPVLDELIRLRTSFSLDDMSPVGAAAACTVPTMIYQVRDDVMTRPHDVQAIYDAVPGTPGTGKTLFWIEGTTRRWDGYLHFQRHPDRVLAWFRTQFAQH